MKKKCDYCGSFIDDTEEVCPNCGGVNEHLIRSADGIPKTIEELKEFCRRKNLPLEQMRFFIGQDYKQPKAFGIYKDNDGNFVVYKNKGSGERVERYRGKDEAYAVNEIYQKLRSEIQIRREKNTSARTKSPPVRSAANNKRRPGRAQTILGVGVLLFIAFIVVTAIISSKTPNDGYYRYGDDYYYYQGYTWYLYDDTADGWYEVPDTDSELNGNYSEYYEGSSYDRSFDISSFSDSPFYNGGDTDAGSDYNDDWDGDDWDWGDDGWDAGDTDWDTDW